ncbi:DUF2306 domain-containing protein [Pseudoflavitalea sp. X16]|uniref:DUF2306 domain-containing protein n=1 Tax=Paraflavitalea devenefica TaxID=2716334 RepID=UPI0014208816|nr:DUF2306 domain-containing protein [Paraflavitalea devenefica]NII25232.1 DUF2306 domain-containing protein [Paraflavitalea devenefica]
MKIVAFIARNLFVYLVLCVGTFLMLRLTASYLAFRDDVEFLRFKQDYIHNPVWKAAFYVHVFTAIIALLAGFTQFSPDFLKRYKKLHRLIGRLYAWDILVINFPAAMIMAVYANGLLPSKIAFVILDCLWFWFTYKAVIAARQKRFTEHKQYMIRSYALTFSAITLRMWKLILSNSFTIDPVTLYMIDAWLGFVPNLLLAEWIIRRSSRKRSHTVTVPTQR